MDDELEAVESRPDKFTLSHDEAQLLSAVGRDLASTSSWWGGSNNDEERSVIKVEHQGGSTYRVVFNDVIGLVRLGKRHIRVLPKIPVEHFLFLAGHSDVAPRVSSLPAQISEGSGFIELLCRWCVDAAELLIKQGLRKEYQEITDELQEVRGSLHTIETATMALCGRAAAYCTYDELSDDAPLNRIVLAACRRIAQLAPITEETRRRARQLAFRMDGVGPMQPADRRARVDRHSRKYAQVIPMAKLLLDGCGISVSVGGHLGSSFLIRTPELVENGLRAILCGALPEFKVTKQRQMLGDSGLSMNPDLVINDGVIVGDIKYKYLASDWNKPDMNQVVAFASAFRSEQCAVFGFVRTAEAPQPRAVPVGTIRARTFGWVASPDVAPADSAAQLSAQVRHWILPSQ